MMTAVHENTLFYGQRALKYESVHEMPRFYGQGKVNI